MDTFEDSLDTAAAAIAARRQPPEPAKADTPAPAKKPAAPAVAADDSDDDPLGVEGGAATTAATDDSGDDDGDPASGNDGDGSDDPDGDDNDGSDDDSDSGAVGDDDAPRSYLETAPPEELDKEIHIPTGPGGELEKVTVRELIRGNLREADYTRKTQQVAQLAQLHVQKRDEYETVLPILIDQIKLGIGERSEQEWADLFAQDPTKYAIERDRERINKEKLSLAQRNLQEIQQEKLRENEHRMWEHSMREANALATKMRGLKDKASVEKFVKDVTSYLKNDPDLRLSDNEIAFLSDHRYFLVAAKAMKFSKMMNDKQAARPKQVIPGAKPNPAPLKPGAPRPSAATSADKKLEKARAELKKTGSFDAAAAAMAAKRNAANRKNRRG